MNIVMLTPEQAEEARQERLNEPGTMSMCPLCGKLRVQRSCYLRCNSCGVNWLDEEMHLPNCLNRNPSAARAEAARMAVSAKQPAGPTVAGAEAERR